MFSIISIFVPIIFVIVIGMFVFTAVKGANQWNKNNKSPVLSVTAKVVTKRAAVSVDQTFNADGTNMTPASSSTVYYATFQVESGDRMELKVSGKEYGMLAEGDTGKLTFQGTRFKGFERDL